MTTAREIVVGAFREGNLIPVGAEPSEAEISEGLGRFNNLLSSLFGIEIGERLADWEFPAKNDSRRYVPATFNPGDRVVERGFTSVSNKPNSNTRILILGSGTVILPDKPLDGARMGAVVMTDNAVSLDAGDRLIEGVSVLDLPTTVGETREWFYRSDLGAWIRIQPLAEDDESPLPPVFDDFLIAALAIRMAPRYSNAPGAATVETFRRMNSILMSRYRQPTPVITNRSELVTAGRTRG